MKAVLVFCEGRHDVVFAQRSLGTHGDCQWVGKPIGELPTPFGSGGVARKGFIARQLERRAIEDQAIRVVTQPAPPCFESIVENPAGDTMYFIFRTLGKTQSEPVLDLLRALGNTMNQPADTFEVSSLSAAFIFDANGEGVAETLARFHTCYADYFGDLSNLKHAQWVVDTTIPVGCFVFHKGVNDQTGTIEDHVAPMAQAAWPDRYSGAERFVDNAKSGDDKVSNSEAERLKAIITVTGQCDHPGDPMSIIVGRNGIPSEQFKKSPASVELADFLVQTP